MEPRRKLERKPRNRNTAAAQAAQQIGAAVAQAQQAALAAQAEQLRLTLDLANRALAIIEKQAGSRQRGLELRGLRQAWQQRSFQ